MEHRSFAPDIVVPNDDYACGNKRAGELAPDVAPEELRQEKQVGGPLNCSDSELCTFLLALEAGFLPTYYSGTNQSVQLKSMSIASRSYQHGKKTVVFHGFPSLQMSSNLMADPGAVASMSSAAGFRAKTLAWPGKDWDWLANAPVFGVKCSASFAKWNRDSYSWKTAQCSLLGGLAAYSATWPRWGLMRGGECWALPMLEPRICESASGLWPTPCKFDQTKSMPHEMEIRNGRPTTISSKGKEGSSPLRAWAAAFTTGSLEVGEHWPPEPGMARMVHGLADGVDRIGAIGNGQVPAVAATAWKMLTGQP